MTKARRAEILRLVDEILCKIGDLGHQTREAVDPVAMHPHIAPMTPMKTVSYNCVTCGGPLDSGMRCTNSACGGSR